MQLTSLQQTFIKAINKQASALKPEQLIKFPAGKTLAIAPVDMFEDKGGHYRVRFNPPITITLNGVRAQWGQGFIYGSHWQGISASFTAKAAIANPYSAAGSAISLQPTPLFIQNDNKDWNDDGSASSLRYGGVQCGLTSMSMLVATLWPNAKVKHLANEAGGQFEDWIAGQFKRLGQQSTAMEGHVAVLQSLGIKATASRSASIARLKQALQTHPAILGLAYKSSGHFTCGVGTADKPGDLPDKWAVGAVDNLIAYPQDVAEAGVLVNDPYGQRDYSGSGNNWVAIAQNRDDTFGLHNVLSVSVLERFWVDGGEESGWAVFVDPKVPNVGNTPDKSVVLSAAVSTAPVAVPDELWRAVKAMAHPDLPAIEVQQLADACRSEFPKFKINTRNRVVHFLAQCAHESEGYFYTSELGNEAYFIDNYEGRSDLGNTQPGDGPRYKGRGLIQTTGRANYQALAETTGLNCVNDPASVATYPLALVSALVWWDRNDMNTLADQGLADANVETVTRRINGGTNGLNDRLNRTDKLKLLIR